MDFDTVNNLLFILISIPPIYYYSKYRKTVIEPESTLPNTTMIKNYRESSGPKDTTIYYLSKGNPEEWVQSFPKYNPPNITNWLEHLIK